jgi:hypothetical protein
MSIRDAVHQLLHPEGHADAGSRSRLHRLGHVSGAVLGRITLVEALRELPKVQARRKPGPEHIDASLLDGTCCRRSPAGSR